MNNITIDRDDDYYELDNDDDNDGVMNEQYEAMLIDQMLQVANGERGKLLSDLLSDVIVDVNSPSKVTGEV